MGSRGSNSGPAQPPDSSLAQVLAHLLRRGEVRLVSRGGGRGLQLVSTPLPPPSDSDDSDGAWDGCLGDRYRPAVDVCPDTRDIESSEISTQIRLQTGALTPHAPHSLTRLLRRREHGLCHSGGFSHGERSRVTTHFLPNHVTLVDSFPQKAFCGVHSPDGQVFMSACQDQCLRVYRARGGRLRKTLTVRARDVGWSVLDVVPTPDNSRLLYSSWSDYIHMCGIDGESEIHTALDLNPDERRFCVFSLTVSSDGHEVLGGANDGCLYVYDLDRNQRTLKVEAHEDDVNAVVFADAGSQILFSGGDDAVCKVWDRRSLREDRPRPVGVLAGHRDGVTFIDSKGDARFLVSNSKDQCIKLWDVRRFSPKEGLQASRRAATQQHWDYRWQQVPRRAFKCRPLVGDTSVMTYRGHGVLHTLIRCRFSPAFTTGQRYIYTGCSTGRLVIYEVLTGRVVGGRRWQHEACVRDVSWHPLLNNIVTTSWDGSVCQWDYQEGEEGGGEADSCHRRDPDPPIP